MHKDKWIKMLMSISVNKHSNTNVKYNAQTILDQEFTSTWSENENKTSNFF